jgi:hypothetical protein
VLQLHSAASIPSEAMLKIKEEEVKIRDGEAGIMTSQIEVGRTEWGLRPRMWEYCAEQSVKNVYEIVCLKNRNSDCMAFRPHERVRPTECLKCQYRDRPISDRYFQAMAGAMDPKIANEIYEAIKKDHELEVMSGWQSAGMLPTKPAFQDWCVIYSGGGRFALCAYMNVYGACPKYLAPDPSFDIHKI